MGTDVASDSPSRLKGGDEVWWDGMADGVIGNGQYVAVIDTPAGGSDKDTLCRSVRCHRMGRQERGSADGSINGKGG